jgi:4-nitrophenyl phosphatase
LTTLKSIRNLILDMDGVLWHGETPMPGLVDFFTTLRRLEINFVLATNNATKTAVLYTQKLARFGVELPARQILTSAEATAAYLRDQYPNGAELYVVGEVGLRDALTAQGFHIVTAETVEKGAAPPLVVLGFTRHATYRDLALGALLVHKGARFIGTNPDPSFPSEVGPMPGAGALLAVISTATGVQPTVIGKPGPLLFQEGLQRLGGAPHNTAMVGDRLTTDIVGGQTARLFTILLLSGVTRHEDIERLDIHPDLVLADINALAARLEAEQGRLGYGWDGMA